MLHGFTGRCDKRREYDDAVLRLATRAITRCRRIHPSMERSPVHFLRITRAPIVYSDATHHKFIVFLELNQPDLGYGISEEAQRIMSADHSTGRW